jgi:peptidyl-prolyl cis-trans isomerase C
MNKKIFVAFIVFSLICFNIFLMNGCTSKKEDKQKPVAGTTQGVDVQQLPASGATSDKVIDPATVIVDVDGSKLTQGQINDDINKNLSRLGGKIPADRLEKFKDSLRKQLINQFIIRSLLSNEVNRLKITATDKEVNAAIEQLKSSLPQGITIEKILKKNNINEKSFREEIHLGVQTKKLVLSTLKGNTKPPEKEIAAFYQKNKDLFKVPESVHARQILIATTPKDDEKAKAEKKAKAEEIRNSLIENADFAEMAKKFSDCPSKENGGDLGTFYRGQMAKPFENAAFSQEKNAIGPVVETEYGYHIIQVLEHNQPTTMSLDQNKKERISLFLEQQKQQDAFQNLVKSLKAKAKIAQYVP